MSKTEMYCLAKSGKLFIGTLGDTKDDCWSNGGYELVCEKEGCEWREKYWKKWDASKRAAIRAGWVFQRVKIVPMVKP